MGESIENKALGAIWSSFDVLRGSLNPTEIKKYVYNLFFLKCISSNFINGLNEIDMPKETSYQYIYDNRENHEIGRIINRAIALIEKNNPKLKDTFIDADFTSKKAFGNDGHLLKSLIELYNNLELDENILGNIFENLLEKEAKSFGKSSGEHFTPLEVSKLIAKLVEAKENNTIHDPAVGTGSLLIKTAQEIKSKNFDIYVQEINKDVLSICKMNLFLHGMGSNIVDAKIGNTLLDPQILKENQLRKFDIVISNPSFSLSNWWKKGGEDDPHDRFIYGMPPKNSGDYAFIMHILNVLEDDGHAAVIVPHGVLFRGRVEKSIRKEIIKDNLVDAVIGLPENLFYNTSIPVAIIIFKKNRQREDILFIDASRDYIDELGKNRMSEENIEKIYNTYKKYKEIDKYSYVASKEEIKKYDYNLNIPLYVDTFEKEELIDREEIKKK